MSKFRIVTGDCMESMQAMDAESVQTCITSPPYFGLRDYGHDGQIGMEETPEQFVSKMVEVFREVRRVLRDDGTLWLNLGDSYAGIFECAKPKDLLGIPWMVALALRADGWYLRQDIIWHKPNPMPESVTDRCTKAHEYLFLLAKSPRYFFDSAAFVEKALRPEGAGNKTHKYETASIADDRHRTAANLTNVGPRETRNKRSVWTVPSQPFAGAHFATFPPKLIEPCVLAGSAKGDTVFDPFTGSGTTGMVALRHERDFIGCELNPDYAQMARHRIFDDGPLLNVEAAA